MLHTVCWKSLAENLLCKTVIDFFRNPNFFTTFQNQNLMQQTKANPALCRQKQIIDTSTVTTSNDHYYFSFKGIKFVILSQQTSDARIQGKKNKKSHLVTFLPGFNTSLCYISNQFPIAYHIIAHSEICPHKIFVSFLSCFLLLTLPQFCYPFTVFLFKKDLPY